MALKIKFSRVGRKNLSLFRIVVAESKSRRDGAPVDLLGRYNPYATSPETKVTIDSEKLKYWLSKGARPTDKVNSVLKKIISSVNA